MIKEVEVVAIIHPCKDFEIGALSEIIWSDGKHTLMPLYPDFYQQATNNIKIGDKIIL